jgi:hypothetical protein
MAFPNVAADFETFFEPTRIWLFGKPFPSVTYKRESMSGKKGVNPPPTADADYANEFVDYSSKSVGDDGGWPDQLGMPPRRIERALRRQSKQYKADGSISGYIPPIFARIYSFSFEGHYYKLPRPLLFLVYGDGTYAGTSSIVRHPEEDASKRVRGFNTKFAGIESRDWHFADDIKVWQVDRRDMAVCLDVEVGPYQEVLLDSMVAFEEDRATRGPGSSRGSFASRGSMSFRGSMVGPHQDR